MLRSMVSKTFSKLMKHDGPKITIFQFAHVLGDFFYGIYKRQF